MARVVVSGGGPSGLLAALALFRAGHSVILFEKRVEYRRPIVHQLRASFLRDLGAIDADAADVVAAVCSPLSVPRGGDRPFEQEDDDSESASPSLADTLCEPPRYCVRIDDVEVALARYLSTLCCDRLRLCSSKLHIDNQSDDVNLRTTFVDLPWELEQADLVVVAEGGKPAAGIALGCSPQVLSSSRFYMSAFVDVDIGTTVRRFSREDGGVAFAVGSSLHQGAWLVIECPRDVVAKVGRGNFARRAFVEDGLTLLHSWARAHADDDSDDNSEGHGAGREKLEREKMERAMDGAMLAGTFRFQQQLLARPMFSQRVVFFGDAAGMGHPWTSGALVAAMADVAPLLARASSMSSAEVAQQTYARAVLNHRLDVVVAGAQEYEDVDVEAVAALRRR